MDDLMAASAAAADLAEDVRLVRPALAAFLQNSVKLDRRELLIENGNEKLQIIM